MSLLPQFENKKIYLCSDSDLDGIGAIIIAKYYIEPIAKQLVIYSTADRSLPDFDFQEAAASDIIIFTDIAPPDMSFYDKINSKQNVFIFDHHESSRQILGDLPNYEFAPDRCGTRIFFDSLTENMRVKKALYQFVELVDIYDRYITGSGLWRQAKGLSNVMYSTVPWRQAPYLTDIQKHDIFIKNQLMKIEKNTMFFFTPIEQQAMAKAEAKEKESFEKALKSLKLFTDDSGNNYGTFSVVSKLSWVSFLLLQHLGEKVKYLIGYASWDKSNIKVSLRSSSGFDCTLIAAKWSQLGYQTGGHPNAVGFECKSKEEVDNLLTGKIKLI